ncbi:MAG: hypothetical protein V3R49_07015 [Gammaproteobacteria bacterium]
MFNTSINTFVQQLRVSILLILMFLLTACGGGGGGGGGGPLTGYFQDSPVSGLNYSCSPSGEAATTGTGGAFIYEAGDTCTFSLGAVILGSTTAGAIITPVELVSGGTPSHPTVINIVQLLTTADDNGNLSDGINIPPAASTAAETATVIIASPDFDTEVVQLVNEMFAASSGTTGATLTDATAAQDHMLATASCVYSGTYMGTFTTSSGDGEWGVVIFPDLSAIAAAGDNDGYGDYTGSFDPLTNMFSLTGTWTDDSVVPPITTGDSATGSLTSPQTVVGTTFDGVSFTGSRLGGSSTAIHRYTGYYIGDATGVFSIDVDVAGVVTGRSVSFEDGSIGILGGNVYGADNEILNIVQSEGMAVMATIDLVAGTITGGTWSDINSADTGTFSGSGCQLN